MADKSPKRLFPRPELLSRRWIAALDGDFHKWAGRNAERLDVKRKARENGRNNLPHTCDEELDVVQSQIVDSYDSGANSLSQALWNRLRGALDLIVDCIPKPLDPASVVARANIALARARDEARDGLVAKCHDERESWRDLKLFKAEHELARGASYPRSRPPILVVAALLSALALESILNGMIFREVSPSYTVGGIVQALAFSVVNVCLGYFVLGFAAARHSGHRTEWKRWLGWVGVGAAILLGTLWNLYVAHYREEAGNVYRQFLATGNLEALTTVLINAGLHLWHGAFNLPSWPAIVLLVVGLLIFFALGVEGYQGWDDVYPGYGLVDRRHKEARLSYENAVRALKENIRALLRDAHNEFEGLYLAGETRVADAREIESEAHQAIYEAHDSASDLARSCLEILRDYREANTYVRTSDPPKYFKAYPKLETPKLIDEELPAEIATRLAEAEAALKLNAEARVEFGRLLIAATHDSDAQLASYLEGVRAEATFRANLERDQDCDEDRGGPKDPTS